jgi:hypothetical protein
VLSEINGMGITYGVSFIGIICEVTALGMISAINCSFFTSDFSGSMFISETVLIQWFG